MAVPQPPEIAQPPAQVVGDAFVRQYYHILHHSPELVYRFYQDASKLGRPEEDGTMSCVSTMQAINQKIMSMDYKNFKGEIKTIDAQESLNGGVIVLVTGSIAREDGWRRSFTQTFFLAPQDKGFFVLNDVFRYVEEDVQQESPDLLSGTETGSPETNPSSLQDTPSPAQEEQNPDQEDDVQEEEAGGNPEVYDPSEEEGSVVDEELPTNEVVVETSNVSVAVVETVVVAAQEETPKKSYASIVKVMKENISPLPSSQQNVAKPVHVKQERQINAGQGQQLAPEVASSNSNGSTDNGAVQEVEAEGCSIYIKNLPMNATPAQLEEAFKKYGPIKNDGVQVRSHKQQGFCFGFVQFLVPTAVQSAIEESPITIGGRLAYVEEKRASGSRVNNRGRYPPGRGGGGFRNDGMRGGHGNYGGGRGYPKGDYPSRGDLGNRGGSRGDSIARGEKGYQRVDNVGRSSRGGGMSANASRNLPPRVAASA